MNRKFFLKKKQIERKMREYLELNEVRDELIMPGEPMLYSLKYKIGERYQPAQFFRNKKWSSRFKCFFRAYKKHHSPVVLLVKLYVTPPAYETISAAAVRAEKTPAKMAYEICDYLLSLLEMFKNVLVETYRQFVKIDVEKYYSANPRTVFRFMSWERYVLFQNNNSVQPYTESVCKTRKIGILQPEL